LHHRYSVATENVAKRQGFLGRAISLLLMTCLLGFLGVLAVDLYIEHRGRRLHATADSGSPDESSRKTLVDQRDQLT